MDLLVRRRPEEKFDFQNLTTIRNGLRDEILAEGFGGLSEKKRLRQAAHGSIDITSSLDICEGGLIPRRHKEGHVRQLSNWDA